MHLSTHNWMRIEPLEATLKRIRKLGYKSIELVGDLRKYRNAETRNLLKLYKIRCWGSVVVTFGDRSFVAQKPEHRASTVAYAIEVIDMVSELEGNHITLVPTAVGNLTPQGTPEEEWQWLLEGCKECYEHGLKKGVKIAIEPINRFEVHMINRADQALAMAKQVGKQCGVCLDAFHLNIEDRDMYAVIRKVGRRLVDFHVADNNRMAPGMGAFNWKKIVRTLKEVGYDGGLAAEFVAPIDRTPVSKYPNQIEKNPQGVSEQERKFIEDHGSSLVSEEFYTMLAKRTAKTLLPLIGGK
jgi:sugar phosphate isomerase/epimerase